MSNFIKICFYKFSHKNYLIFALYVRMICYFGESLDTLQASYCVVFIAFGLHENERLLSESVLLLLGLWAVTNGRHKVAFPVRGAGDYFRWVNWGLNFPSPEERLTVRSALLLSELWWDCETQDCETVKSAPKQSCLQAPQTWCASLFRKAKRKVLQNRSASNSETPF